MASEDVIELGSSDDETEPAPKKSKPMPNAMVCIPGKLHDVTIKPTKLNPTTVKGFVKKGVPIVKSVLMGKGGVANTRNVIANPFAAKLKPLNKLVQKVVLKPHLKLIKPISIQKPSNSSNSFIKKPNPLDLVNMSAKVLKNPIRIQNPKTLSNLPPSITVKRTTPSSTKPIIFINASSQVRMKPNADPGIEVPTVELDDDEGTPPTSSPAWYLRPEEQEGTQVLEKENNKEAEPPTMIEITIEDSPIKHVINKRTCEIGTELAITIDDSPVKITAEKDKSISGSDNEESSSREPHSKKKLEYPKEAENENRKTVEIEIHIPPEVGEDYISTSSYKNIEYEEVSIVSDNKTLETNKKIDSPERNTLLKIDSIASTENRTVNPSSSVKSEFHSVYQSFIDVCFELENSDDMTKIVEKKIKGYYRQVPKEYTESEEFIDMVASKIVSMKANPEKMYLYIKDIVDELNLQRKLAKSQLMNKESKTEEPEQFMYGEESEYDSKRQRQIRKLEKTIKKLHRAIQKLEEQEVDFDDEDDSVYLLTERYKERMVRVYTKFCQLTNTKMPSEPRIQIDARLGQPSGPAKRLEKWINKKVPIGTPLPFPDFHDVIRCVRDANDEDKLGWNEVDIMEEARDLFTRCGKKLQRRRQENEWRLAASRIAFDIDPAENNEQLKCKLEENKKVAMNKETDIFNKYADRQNQLKLEAEEIGDKEAEESPVESEEDEANDESVSLQNKEKRKERLKRLLHERSKRLSEGKENQPSEDSKINIADAKMPETNKEEIKIKESEIDIKEKNEDSAKILETSHNNDKNSLYTAETLSVSDDSTNLESDIDELHLLQKLHSGNELETSTLESSDSESPIAISDSLESGSDTKKQLSDVISIENSSYSESEVDKVDSMPFKNTESIDLIVPDGMLNKETEVIVHAGMETECSNTVIDTENSSAVMDLQSSIVGTKKIQRKPYNKDFTDIVEDVLPASSDDENGGSQEEGATDGACINLRDDLISIDETVVGLVADKPEKDSENEPNVSDKESKSDEASVFNTNKVELKDDKEANEKLNTVESTYTSQNNAHSASEKKSGQKNVNLVLDDTKSTTLEAMDVDQDEIVEVSEKKSNGVEEDLLLTL